MPTFLTCLLCPPSPVAWSGVALAVAALWEGSTRADALAQAALKRGVTGFNGMAFPPCRQRWRSQRLPLETPLRAR